MIGSDKTIARIGRNTQNNAGSGRDSPVRHPYREPYSRRNQLISLLSLDNGAAINGMSEREYSAHSGLSRGAIQNAKRSGRLVFYADGSINAAASDVRQADMTDLDQQRRSLGGDAALPTGGNGGTDSYLEVRIAVTVY